MNSYPLRGENQEHDKLKGQQEKLTQNEPSN